MRTSASTGGGFVSRLGADMAGSTEKVILPYRRQAGLRNRVNRTFALMTLKGSAGREKKHAERPNQSRAASAGWWRVFADRNPGSRCDPGGAGGDCAPQVF